jgi:hypothetical protein
MKEITSMTRKKTAVTLAAVAALALGLGATTFGNEAALHTNHFTFKQAVAIPGAVLSPGTYIFERVEATEPDVIVVRDKDRSRVYFLGFTDRIDRPRNLRVGSAVTLGEARPNEPVPIVAWYPLDSTRGHRFIYTR